MNHGSWKSTAKSHTGSVRPFNEDAFLNEPDAGLWCVADGMGGHLKGDVASTLIVQKLSELIAKSTEINSDLIKRAIDDANTDIQGLSKQLGEKVGSTVAVLYIEADVAHALWAGDSRIYHYSDNKLKQITDDHNQAEELVKYGFLPRARAKGHPGSNLLTRAVGTNRSLLLEHKTFAWKATDKFILCTDGLNKVLEDTSIEALLTNSASDDLSERLIKSALDSWALDNVTAITVHCGNP